MANYRSSLTGSQMDDALSQMNNRVPEGWAVGERDGVPVGEESLYYHNNAKYYAEQAQAQAESAEESAESASQVAQETADAVIAQAFVQESAEVGSIVTIDDGADNIPLKDLKVNLAINQPLHGQANPYPAGGGKNLAPFTFDGLVLANTTGTWNGNQYTNKGITFTVNTDDGGNVISIVANGTATADWADIVSPTVSIKAGSYIQTGVTNGDSTSYRLSSGFGDGQAITTYNNPNNVTLQNDTTVYYRCIIRASGYVASNVVFQPMLRLSTESADYAPYSNICPIYPVTEAEVSRTGTNVWDEEWELGSIKFETGELISSSVNIRSKNKIPVVSGVAYYGKVANLPRTAIVMFFYRADDTYISNSYGDVFTVPQGTAYMRFYCGSAYGATYNHNISINYPSTDHDYHSGAGNAQHLVNIGINQWDEQTEQGYIGNDGTLVSDASSIRSANYCACIGGTQYCVVVPASRAIHWYDKDKTHLSYDGIGAPSTVVTAPANAAYFKLSAYLQGYPYANNMSVNFPARFNTYHAYTGNVVYGGELDVTTGVLTARYASVDLGTLTWTLNSGSTFWAIPTGKLAGIDNFVCSEYATTTADIASMANCTTTGRSANQRVYIRDDRYTDAATFKAAMSGVQLVYELATPISIQLTPTEVDTLRGDNVIWADCGDIKNCEYRADLKMYIDKVVGA